MTKDPYLNELLGDREEIELVTRQHWFVLVEKTLAEGILAILIVVFISLLIFVVAPLLPFLLPLVPLLAFGYALVLIPLGMLIRDYLVWYNRKYIVSSRRVIHVSGVLSKNVTDSSLEKVNDVKMVQSFLGRLFGYGDIEILTASELGVNLFRRIGDPVGFKTAMLNAKERLDSGPMSRSMPASAAGPTGVPGLIEQLDSLRRQGVLTEEEFQRKKTELLAKL